MCEKVKSHMSNRHFMAFTVFDHVKQLYFFRGLGLNCTIQMAIFYNLFRDRLLAGFNKTTFICGF